MNHQELLKIARNTGLQRARPLESNFPVGAAFEFSNGEIRSGANYEDQGKTPVGACAERNTLVAANNEFGPLSNAGKDGKVSWTTGALWAGTPIPPTPCGICRDALAGASMPDALVISKGEGHAELQVTIGELLPLAGRGPDRDVSGEIEIWAKRGGLISDVIPAASEKLLYQARLAAERSYLPPFTKEPPSGASIEMTDGSIITGWFVTDATTRLGGSPIVMAIRRALEGPYTTAPRAIRVAMFTDSEALRAPSGYDLQALQEIAEQETPVVFASRNKRAFTAPLSALCPKPFGRRDLGY